MGRGKPLEQADDTDEGMVLIKARAENVVRGRLVKGPGERILRCESSQRRVKEQAMKERFRQRFEEGLSQIRASLGEKRGTKSYEKVLERLGRFKERRQADDIPTAVIAGQGAVPKVRSAPGWRPHASSWWYRLPGAITMRWIPGRGRWAILGLNQ